MPPKKAPSSKQDDAKKKQQEEEAERLRLEQEAAEDARRRQEEEEEERRLHEAVESAPEDEDEEEQEDNASKLRNIFSLAGMQKKKHKPKPIEKPKKHHPMVALEPLSPELLEKQKKIHELQAQRDRMRAENEAAEARRREEEEERIRLESEIKEQRSLEKREQRVLEAAERIQTIEQRKEERSALLAEQRELERKLKETKPLHVLYQERAEEEARREKARVDEMIKQRRQFMRAQAPAVKKGEETHALQSVKNEYSAMRLQEKVHRDATMSRLAKQRDYVKGLRDRLPPIRRAQSMSPPPPLPVPEVTEPLVPKRSRMSIGNEYLKAVHDMPKKIPAFQTPEPTDPYDDLGSPREVDLRKKLGDEYLRVAKKLGDVRQSGEVPTKIAEEADVARKAARLATRSIPKPKGPQDIDAYIKAVKAKMDLLQKLSK